jgi:hypothetical protein
MGHGPSPSNRRLIDDVVVEKRGRVDELDDGPQEDGGRAVVPAEPGRQNDEQRAKTFSSALKDISPHLSDQRDSGREEAGHLFFDAAEILAVADPDVLDGDRSGHGFLWA